MEDGRIHPVSELIRARKKLVFLLSALSLLFLSSCTGNLDKEEAKNVIEKTGLFPGEKIEGLKLTYPLRFSMPVMADMYQNMSDQGLLTIDTIHAENRSQDDDIVITLTPYGQKFIGTVTKYNNDSTAVFVVVGKELFNAIDSVVMNKNGINAEVYFTTKIVELTPFGKVTNYKENATFPYAFDFVKKNGSWEVTYYH